MLDDLDIAFIEGGMVDLKSYDINMLFDKLEKIRELRTKKLEEVKKIINDIKSEKINN